MGKRILTGNESVARGALVAGASVITGYPGTPSTGCIGSIIDLDLPGRHIEWSANEKVAFEIATGAAWAGRRALCTMKMSGLNVAYDAVISVAYSGTNGGLVIYVADDPGVSAGMAEEDTRGFALMADLPMLEPSSPSEAYRLVKEAFEISERTGSIVMLRLTTEVALGAEPVEVDEIPPLEPAEPILEKDITCYTKAGSAICREQHRRLIDRLAEAEKIVRELGLNRLELGEDGGVGIVAVGAVDRYLDEGLEAFGLSRRDVSILHAVTTIPFPREEVRRLLARSGTVLVLEELEPHFERGLILEAREAGFAGRIVGKLDQTLSRIGEYALPEVLAGLSEALGRASKDDRGPATKIPSPAPRPITVCAGCPHRGTYMAIEMAIERAGFSKDEVMVTGDIGCTILGMNPPFEILWTEVSMGTSVSLAQGYVHAGVRTPVIATIGDSTFFHAGIPGLINAVQHRVPLTLVVMDNGWTSMTGMQVNPGTSEEFQPGGRRVDLEAVIRGLGVDRLSVVDPYDLEETAGAIEASLKDGGVNVVLARRECAIQARRRGVVPGRIGLDPEKCVLCKECIRATGCPAISIGDGSIEVDYSQCNGCGLCVPACPTGALFKGGRDEL